MTLHGVLRAAPEYPEGERPAFVQKLVRPAAVGRATSLAFLVFEKKDLVRAERFWSDFGLTRVSRTESCLLMRAAGPSPAVIVARRGKAARFVGAAFEVDGNTDFNTLRHQFDAQPLPQGSIPGGGEGVCLKDPDGNEVWLIKSWSKVDPVELPPPLTNTLNALKQVRRVNQTVRHAIEAARVGRLGHVVLQTTDFAKMADWYMRLLGLIPTDVQYLPDGSPMLTFFRLDLGQTPADHHTLVIAGGIEARYEHSAWEVADLDALGQGQQVLKANGHRHMWGIGRHLLGSQLFDYWFDDDGMEFEHYTDGDVFTSDYPTHYVPFTTASIWAWGDDVPPSMFPKKTLATLLKVLRLLRFKRMSLTRLRMVGGIADTPARPWL